MHFTPEGMKIEGDYENERNSQNRDLFKAMIREAYGCRDVIVGHHLVYVIDEKRDDGFTYQVVQEVPSADALIFDHDRARKLWGDDFMPVLLELAALPCPARDVRLKELFEARK